MAASNFQEFISKFYSNTLGESSVSQKIMLLSIFVDSDDNQLKDIYIKAAEKHNNKLIEDPYFYDAGFDLYLPREGEGARFFSMKKDSIDIPVNKVDFKVKCCAKIYNRDSISSNLIYTPFYTYARSSISKTSLRLANNQGIIDAGYRGSIIGMFDCIYKNEILEPYSRILQICAPSLMPIFIEIVDSLEQLGPSTSRGTGGFGSTGK